MPCLLIEARRRIVCLLSHGYYVKNVYEGLQQENVDISVCAIYLLVKKFKHRGSDKKVQ